MKVDVKVDPWVVSTVVHLVDWKVVEMVENLVV